MQLCGAWFVVAVLVAGGCGGTPDDEGLAPGLTASVPPVVRDACREAREKLGATRMVYCPPIVPSDTTENNLAIRFGSGYMLDFASPGGPSEHWFVSGASPQAHLRSISVNGEPDAKGTTTIDGTRVKVYWVHGYQNQSQGHVVYLWRHDGESYLVSVHGLRNEPIVQGIAEGLIAQMN